VVETLEEGLILKRSLRNRVVGQPLPAAQLHSVAGAWYLDLGELHSACTIVRRAPDTHTHRLCAL